MNQIIMNYITDKVLDDLRTKRLIAPELADHLVTLPMAEAFRSRLVADDSVWIKELLASDFEGTLHFALSIVRPLQAEKYIKSLLNQLWQKKDLSPRVRYGLIFRLLDYPDLESSILNQIYKWIMENREYCSQKDLIWYETKEFALKRIQYCLNDPTIPDSKKWIYLIELCSLEHSEEIRNIIKSYVGNNEKITADIAKKLLKEME